LKNSRPYFHRFMVDFINGSSPTEVLKLASNTVDDFVKELISIFELKDYKVKFMAIDDWDHAEGDKLVILPYSEISEDGRIYFLSADILEAMDNPDLEKLKLLSWEMILGRTSYILYENFEEVRKFEFKGDVIILANLLASSTLIRIEDIRTLLAVLDAKLKTIRLELESLEDLEGMEVLNFTERELLFNDARAKVIRASVQFIDAAILSWMAMQSLSLAPLLHPEEEIIRIVKKSLFEDGLLEKPGEIFQAVLGFYDLLKAMNRGKGPEIVEIGDKIMMYRQKLGLDYYPSTQDIMVG